MSSVAMVLDTSILLEILLRTPHGVRVVDSIYRGKLEPHTTYLNMAEALYVLCKRLGYEEAWRQVKLLLDSGYFAVHGISEIYRYVGDCKCRFPISLADCTTLSLAKMLKYSPLFFKLEKEFKEILGELEGWLGTKIMFLQGK